VCGLCLGMRDMDSTPPDVAVGGLAARQWGVVATGQLLGVGLSRSGIARRVAAGRLHPVHRAVYAVVHPGVLRPEGRRLAAVLACGEGAVLSHVTAAAHWELVDSAAARVDVTAPVTRAGMRGIRLHRLGLSDVLCEVGVTDAALGAGKGILVLPEDEVH
jgi:hypothetical protein